MSLVISFFSVSFDLIVHGEALPFDLYVNASAVEKKQKFIRIFPQGETLTLDDLNDLKAKYLQVYISENQRDLYMKSLVKSGDFTEVEAAEFIKESAIKYLHNVFDPDKEFSTEVLSETIRGSKDAVENMIDVLDGYSIDGLRGLIGNLSGHDFYTYDHSINVSMYCITIMKIIKPSSTKTELIHAGLGGLLHDLGKIKIPTEILNNPGGLSSEDYEIIKTHPDLGLGLLMDNEDLDFDDLDLATIARVIHEHHESWNGSGYPSGKKEKEIHLLARVCAIADFFDAITTKRSYSDVVTVTQGLSIMEKTSGKKIDPKIFKIFSSYITQSKIEAPKDLQMQESFDPSIPWENFPLEEFEEMFETEDFGKIKIIEKKGSK